MYGSLLSAHRHSCDSPSSYYVVLIFRVVREFHHQSFSGFLLSLSTWRDALGGTSAAFDMVDHQILLERLETLCGISSLPLLWIESYLSDHTQMIVSGESITSWIPILLGVPQGSVLGPLLFILYTADIPTILSKYSAT